MAAGLPVVLQDGTNTYVYGLDLISRTDQTGAQTYYFTDGLGSTLRTVNGSTGATVSTYRYDVFDELRSPPAGMPKDTMLFGSEQYDAKARGPGPNGGLVYLRARYYDPAIGRFLSRDPLPTGNLYAYVRNNPANFADPTGLVGSGPAGLLQCTGQFDPRCEAVGGGGGGIIVIIVAGVVVTVAVEGIDLAEGGLDEVAGVIGGLFGKDHELPNDPKDPGLRDIGHEWRRPTSVDFPPFDCRVIPDRRLRALCWPVGISALGTIGCITLEISAPIIIGEKVRCIPRGRVQ